MLSDQVLLALLMNMGVAIVCYTFVSKRSGIVQSRSPPEIVTAMTAVEQWICNLLVIQNIRNATIRFIKIIPGKVSVETDVLDLVQIWQPVRYPR